MNAVLALAAVALLASLAGCASEPPADARAIDVDVKRYDYTPGTDTPINLTQGETIILRLHGKDVTHGFSIVGYGVNVEVPPGQTIEVTLKADKAGDFTIYCTVFCGTGHPQHKGTLHVAAA